MSKMKCPKCGKDLKYYFGPPKDTKHGDLTTNIAIIFDNHIKKCQK